MKTLFVTFAASGLFAADAAPGVDLWSPLINAGLAGVVIVLLLLGKLVPGRTHDAVVAERDRLQEELRQRAAEDREQLIPTMVRNTEALTRVIEVLGPSDRGGRR